VCGFRSDTDLDVAVVVDVDYVRAGGGDAGRGVATRCDGDRTEVEAWLRYAGRHPLPAVFRRLDVEALFGESLSFTARLADSDDAAFRTATRLLCGSPVADVLAVTLHGEATDGSEGRHASHVRCDDLDRGLEEWQESAS
jgi:hypothetical protein